MVDCFTACPDHLHAQCPTRPTTVVVSRLEAEADEMWNFVQKKANKQWIWIAMDATTRQIIAFHVGDRRREGGKDLWANIPTASFNSLSNVLVLKGVIIARSWLT